MLGDKPADGPRRYRLDTTASTASTTTTRSGPNASNWAWRRCRTARISTTRVSRSVSNYVYNHIGGLATVARIAGQVAVPRRRHPALPRAALRLPRRRRGLGLQPLRRPDRPLEQAQRRDDPRARSRPPRCRRADGATSRSTATTRCRSGSTGSAQFFSRPGGAARRARRVLRARMIERPRISATCSCPTSTSAARPTTRWSAWAFADKVNPLGARLRAMIGSDISHWDVPDMTEPVAEAYELVEQWAHHRRRFPRVHFPQPGAAARGHESRFFEGTDVREGGR